MVQLFDVIFTPVLICVYLVGLVGKKSTPMVDLLLLAIEMV